MTVKWETDLPTSSIVEWGRDLSFGQIVSSPTTGTRHRVRLTGLTPETYYYYRVQSRDAVSSPARFMTAPLRRTPFRCVVYGDNREPATMHKAIITEMVKDMPTMVVHVGDVSVKGNEVWRWKAEFFDLAQAMLRLAPFYVAIGNHDYEGDGYTHFAEYFETPSPDPRGTYYAFTYGNARFIILDSNWFDNPAQMTWLQRELDSAEYRSATWHFVVLHHPPYYNTLEGGWPWQRTNLLPLLEQHGLDILFGGHAHVYERGELRGLPHIITAGGGAPLHQFIPYWDFLTLHGEFYHYCVLDIDGESLRFRAIRLNHVVYDEFVMTKRGRPFAVHEEFAYPDGRFVGKNGGSGWAEPWRLVSGTSPTIRAMQAVLSAPTHLARRFSASHGGVGTARPYWIQAVLQRTGGAMSGSAELRFGDAFAIGQAPGHRFFGLSIGGTVYDSSIPVDSRPHRFVLEVVPPAKMKNGAVYLWVDPDDRQGLPKVDVAVTGLNLGGVEQLDVEARGVSQTNLDDIVLTYNPLLLDTRNSVRRWPYYGQRTTDNEEHQNPKAAE